MMTTNDCQVVVAMMDSLQRAQDIALAFGKNELAASINEAKAKAQRESWDGQPQKGVWAIEPEAAKGDRQ